MSGSTLQGRIDQMRGRLADASPTGHYGHVHQVCGLVIEAIGPNLAIGDMCEIETRDGGAVFAEVVGFRDNKMLLMPLGDLDQIAPGSRVSAANHQLALPNPEAAVGRIIDAMGNPIDGKGPLATVASNGLNRNAPSPLERMPISDCFTTGVRAIDLFVPVGRGQRLGIFAGSGVGKSTLLGMLVRGSESDINVVALIGERGREVREFVESALGEEALQRSVVVVSTSDQPAMLRLRAAFLATSLAESYRDGGHNVLFLMDSVTRFAMAQREIGLSVMEPPASRGYPPSVFSMLPRLLERTGNSANGTITALYTVLVEGDDMNEPITDAVRGILDGHIVLSRKIATSNIFPAIDVLESISRLNTAISSAEELKLVGKARQLLALYRDNEDLINIGAYAKQGNAQIDEAIKKRGGLLGLIQQGQFEQCGRAESYAKLKEIVT
jgi:flagellum-specific ATP synthase